MDVKNAYVNGDLEEIHSILIEWYHSFIAEIHSILSEGIINECMSSNRYPYGS
jgi:hypothetical protein